MGKKTWVVGVFHCSHWFFFSNFRFMPDSTLTVAGFEKAFVDPLIKLNNGLVWCETWNSVANCLEIQSGLFLYSLKLIPSISQVNVVNTIHLSFIKYSIDQNKTAACLSGNSIQYYFHAPNFHNRIVQGMQKLYLQKTTVWILIVLNCYGKYWMSVLFQRINILKFWTDTFGSVNSIKYLVRLI